MLRADVRSCVPVPGLSALFSFASQSSSAAFILPKPKAQKVPLQVSPWQILRLRLPLMFLSIVQDDLNSVQGHQATEHLPVQVQAPHPPRRPWNSQGAAECGRIRANVPRHATLHEPRVDGTPAVYTGCRHLGAGVRFQRFAVVCNLGTIPFQAELLVESEHALVVWMPAFADAPCHATLAESRAGGMAALRYLQHLCIAINIYIADIEHGCAFPVCVLPTAVRHLPDCSALSTSCA